MEDNRRIFAQQDLKYQRMTLQLISDFKNQVDKNRVLKLLAEAGRRPQVDCMNLQGFTKVMREIPVYAFVGSHEVVLLMIDWNDKPTDELADEEGFGGHAPRYFSSNNSRQSPVWLLTEFTCKYKQALADAHIQVPYIWSVLVSNSTFVNYDDMTEIWELMGMTVYHDFGKRPKPDVHFSHRYHDVALAQYKAFRLWCEQHEDLPKDPYAFEDIDADYDEMEYGLDDDDDNEDVNEDFDDDDDDDFFGASAPDIDLSQFPEGAVSLSQRHVIHVEILQPLPSPREELEKLVGCQNIKSQINDLLQLTRYNRWMSSRYPDWKQHNISLHAIFLGRPGTGKTTVCKIYGGLLKEVGVLSKGHVVVCNRSTFLGSNWGDEEKAIRQILEKAEGGVLMIDEAYLLNSSHPNDPGKLVLPQFMEILANEEKRDIAIVLCGYKEPMQKLLDLNPGLASRFPNRFEFEDFSVDDLIKITLHRISEYGYHFTRAGFCKYRNLLKEAYNMRDPQTWGNARFVANRLEHIYLLHAKRCMRNSSSRKSKAFFNITPSDIQPIEVPKEKRRIGF